jgi:hypothetical protein
VNHVILAITFEDYFQHKGGQNSFTSGDNLNAMAGLGFVNQTGGAAISAGGYYLGGGSSINKDRWNQAFRETQRRDMPPQAFC